MWTTFLRKPEKKKVFHRKDVTNFMTTIMPNSTQERGKEI